MSTSFYTEEALQSQTTPRVLTHTNNPRDWLDINYIYLLFIYTCYHHIYIYIIYMIYMIYVCVELRLHAHNFIGFFYSVDFSRLFHFTFVFLTVNKTYFNSSYPRNAVNLFTQSDRCNTSQPRYMKHPEFRAIYSKYQYLPYHQCLPGCVVIDYGNVTKVATYKNVGGIKSDSPVFVNITHNKACVAYDSTSKNPTKGEQTADNVLTGGNSLYPGNIFFAW